MPSRRQFLLASSALGLGNLGNKANSAEVAGEDLPAPKYTLAMNLEIMFPGKMPYEDRLAAAADCGARHYGFWGWQGKNLDAMLKVQEKRGMGCVSISGNPKTGWNTGLTKPGKEQLFLDDFAEVCKIANRFGATNLITFVGQVQPDVPAETQRGQIIAGLKKAGAIAQEHKVYLTLEPLNRVESPKMTMLQVGDAYDYCAGADHPHIKVDFDIYHRALGEGNVLKTLELGLKKGYVRFIEVGDVPGRKEPGTGETNYANIFQFLRQFGYDGAIGMEHGTSTTPRQAWEATRRLAGL